MVTVKVRKANLYTEFCSRGSGMRIISLFRELLHEIKRRAVQSKRHALHGALHSGKDLAVSLPGSLRGISFCGAKGIPSLSGEDVTVRTSLLTQCGNCPLPFFLRCRRSKVRTFLSPSLPSMDGKRSSGYPYGPLQLPVTTKRRSRVRVFVYSRENIIQNIW